MALYVTLFNHQRMLFPLAAREERVTHRMEFLADASFRAAGCGVPPETFIQTFRITPPIRSTRLPAGRSV
jgi:hypothetical protein